MDSWAIGKSSWKMDKKNGKKGKCIWKIYENRLNELAEGVQSFYFPRVTKQKGRRKKNQSQLIMIKCD